jgi:hypothetical protein
MFFTTLIIKTEHLLPAPRKFLDKNLTLDHLILNEMIGLGQSNIDPSKIFLIVSISPLLPDKMLTDLMML